ncbi:MAG: transposase, partial [Melioribacteraceae bacterium]
QPDIKTKKFSLSQIIAYFKYESTKRINENNKTATRNIWQRSFYDRIIRNEKGLYNIRNYIQFNALKWNSDFGDENLEL